MPSPCSTWSHRVGLVQAGGRRGSRLQLADCEPREAAPHLYVGEGSVCSINSCIQHTLSLSPFYTGETKHFTEG